MTQGDPRSADSLSASPVVQLELFLWCSVFAGLCEAVSAACANHVPLSTAGPLLLFSVVLSSLIVVPVALATELALVVVARAFPAALLSSRFFRAGFAVTVGMLALPLLVGQNIRRAGISMTLYHLGPFALILAATVGLAIVAGVLAQRLGRRTSLASARKLRTRGRLALTALLLLAAIDWAWIGISDAGPGPERSLQASAGGPVNAILITIDTLRADHLSSYGYSKKTDPEIRRHFAEGLRFREALVHTPITRPSHASMLTGMHPAVMGLRENHQPVDHRLPFLPEILRREGYRTGAFVSGWPLVGPGTGLQRGFDEYSDAFSPLLKAELALADHTLLVVLSKLRLIETLSRNASATTDDAIDWLRRVHEHPFFLWVHYYDPHHLFEPPPEFSLRMGRAPEAPPNSRQYFSRVGSGEKGFGPEERAQATALYDGEILFTDSQIGRLLDAVAELGLEARTVVLLTADHGETLHERVESEGMAFIHGPWINQRDVRVPFLLRGPGIPPGESAVVAQSYDVAPTLLKALGIDIPDGMMGHDLLSPAVPPPSFENPIMALSAGRDIWKDVVSARAGDWKYILDVTKGTGALFDLGADPGETRDLAASRPEIASQLREAAERVPLERAGEKDLSPAELDRLRALGYVD